MIQAVPGQHSAYDRRNEDRVSKCAAQRPSEVIEITASEARPIYESWSDPACDLANHSVMRGFAC